jgi:hypothetical protein
VTKKESKVERSNCRGKEYLENLGEGRMKEQKGKVKVRVKDQEKERKDMRRKGKVF